MFDQDFFSSLPDNPVLAAHKICEVFCTYDNGIAEGDKTKFAEAYLTALGAMQAFADAYVLNIDFPELGGDREANTRLISGFFQTLYAALDTEVALMTVEEARNQFSSQFNQSHYFQFTDENLEKLHLVLSSMHYHIERHSRLGEESRQRLIRKLDETRKKLRKKMTDLDFLWGLVGEARVVLGNYDEEAKPIIERLNDITRITRQTQGRLITASRNKAQSISSPRSADKKQQ